VSAYLTQALKAMNYADTDVPVLTEAFPPAIVEYFRDFRVQEIRDIIETLLYIYVAQNSCYQHGKGQGVVEQSCFAYTSGPLFALKQLGLIEETSWHGMTVIRTTAAGERIARPLMQTRIRTLDIEILVRDTHPIVPVLLAGTVKGSYVNKTFPSSLPRNERTFINFLINNNPALFEECERFADTLKRAGCAALAYTFDLDGFRTDGVAYTFPPEFTSILKRMLERIDPEVRERYDLLLEALYTRYTVLRYLATGEDDDLVRSSSAHRRELARVLEILGDSVYLLEHVPQTGGADLVRFIIRDRTAYDARLQELGRELVADVADQIVIGRRAERETGETAGGDRDRPPIEYSPPFTGYDADTDDLWERTPETENGIEEKSEPREMPALHPRASARSERGPAPARGDPDSLDIFLGYADDGRSVFWSPGGLNNGHMIIIGGSGAGKTETIRCIASELAARQMSVVLIDFHGDMAASAAGVRSFKIREGGAYYFNPLEIDPAIDEITPLRATSDFVDAISINFPTLGIQQRRKIKNIIKDCYRMAGITGDTATWGRTLDFDEIEGAIMECEDEAIPAYLEDIFDYKLFSGDEKISIAAILSGGITHINLNALPENLRYLFADLFLRRIYYTLQAMGEIPRGTKNAREKFRLFVIVDEAKLLVSQKSSSKQTVRAVLNKYATEMRKFGVSLILASQLIAHFNEEILANIAVKFCMRAENKKQAQANAKFFEVSEKDLLNFQPGEGILIIGSEKMNIRIVPTTER